MDEKSGDLIVDLAEEIIENICEDKQYDALVRTKILLDASDQTFTDKYGLSGLRKQISEILASPEKTRKIKLLQAVKGETETKIEYYDEDIGSDQRIIWQENAEMILQGLMNEIMTVISHVYYERNDESFNLE